MTELLARLDRIIELLELLAARFEPPVPVERDDLVADIARVETAADLARFKVQH